MGLLEHCQELFGTSDLYGVLGISKQASDSEIRRSYYKVSLQVHPDRAPDDAQATEKFQVLGKLYAVLSDKEQRAIYDEQGIVDEEDSLTQDRNWEEYWRLLFPKITLQDIVEFERKYKGSEEERQDVLQQYLQHEGDMDAIMAAALCCTQEDEPRIAALIQDAIAAGDVPKHKAFATESDRKKKARRKRAEKEEREAEEMQKEMGLGSEEDSLVMMLQQRQKSREQGFNSFLADLEAKYAKPGKAKGAKKSKK
ncbi:dnaJ homolog subfamily C member 9-like [Engraulis encrasicolus]|uniref:dnaJ homolog subfamily C member 9-like n=1 Tax=Engraulis encrasicolus TaxID=184585 RepID=UPI002FD56453